MTRASTMPPVRYRWGFRPSLWPTLATLPTLAVLLALGGWQLDRLDQKRDTIAERDTRMAAAPVVLPTEAPADTLAYRRGRATGVFDHTREMYLAARSLRGNVGYNVITPMRLDAGGWLLVDRGWVPLDRRDPARRAAGQTAGTVTVTGLVRRPGEPGTYVPDNVPDENQWFYVDTAAMIANAGLGAAAEARYYLSADDGANPGGWPKGGQTRVTLANPHLQYALTWFALAVALAVIYVLYHRRGEGESEGDGTGADGGADSNAGTHAKGGTHTDAEAGPR